MEKPRMEAGPQPGRPSDECPAAEENGQAAVEVLIWVPLIVSTLIFLGSGFRKEYADYRSVLRSAPTAERSQWPVGLRVR